uniref:MSP domain-containing protein n=1 Tax=Strongyloides papillosus TaxID=174720 RepID=A0A0N5CFA9_STREA
MSKYNFGDSKLIDNLNISATSKSFTNSSTNLTVATPKSTNDVNEQKNEDLSEIIDMFNNGSTPRPETPEEKKAREEMEAKDKKERETIRIAAEDFYNDEKVYYTCYNNFTEYFNKSYIFVNATITDRIYNKTTKHYDVKLNITALSVGNPTDYKDAHGDFNCNNPGMKCNCTITL